MYVIDCSEGFNAKENRSRVLDLQV